MNEIRRAAVCWKIWQNRMDAKTPSEIIYNRKASRVQVALEKL